MVAAPPGQSLLARPWELPMWEPRARLTMAWRRRQAFHQTGQLLVTWNFWVFRKNCFFLYFWIELGGFGGFREVRTGRTVLPGKFSADLVVYGVGKSTFQHFPVNWHFKVVEMASKTLHFLQGLSRTPLLFIPRYFTNIFFENMFQQKYRESKNLKIWNLKKNTGY